MVTKAGVTVQAGLIPNSA